MMVRNLETSFTTSNAGSDSQYLIELLLFIFCISISSHSVNGKLLWLAAFTLQTRHYQESEFEDNINLLCVSIEVQSHLMWHHRSQESHCIAFWLLKRLLLHILRGNFS